MWSGRYVPRRFRCRFGRQLRGREIDRKRVDLVLYGNPPSRIQVVLNPCERQISVGTAGPQLRVPDSSGTAGHQSQTPDLNGHCRVSTASSRSQSLCQRGCQNQTKKMSNNMLHRMPHRLRHGMRNRMPE